jgi:hypothetical protein
MKRRGRVECERVVREPDGPDVKTLSQEEQQLFREWLDAWIRLTEVEAKTKQARGGE